jgi:hypothetical protein
VSAASICGLSVEIEVIEFTYTSFLQGNIILGEKVMHKLSEIKRKVMFYLLKDKIGAVTTEYVILLASASLIATGVGIKYQDIVQSGLGKIEISASNAGAGAGAGAGGKGGKGGKGGGKGGKGGGKGGKGGGKGGKK